jgi:hypothetical protein
MRLCDYCKQLRDERRQPMAAVFGGGIAGLTAAHELSERGFSVDIFEGSDFLGGMAATQKYYSERIFGDKADANPLPGEHGFRAFYSFYRHLTDTMERIPLWERIANDERAPENRRPPGPPRSVADNLIPTYKVAVALEGDIFREIQYDRRQPRSVAAASYALGVWMVAMGFPSSDIVRLMSRLLQFMTSCRERRYTDLATKSLFDYLGAEGLSEQFKKRFANISRFLVAIDPTQGDALTQAMIMCRLLMDPVVSGESSRNVDRVLNGPSTERWFDPWAFFLKQQNVRFFFKQNLDRFQVRNGAVVDAHLTCGSDECDNQKGYRLNARQKDSDRYRYFVSAVAGDRLAEILSASDGLLAADARETEAHAREQERLRTRSNRAANSAPQKPEQASSASANSSAQTRRAAWVKDARASATGITGDPDLRSWVDLVRDSEPITAKSGGTNYGPWMSGIQFYLSDAMTVLPGHIHFPDSPWALTAVCQSQFWGGDFFWRYGKGKVRAILSVDICEFNKKGEKHKKKALNCSAQEIAQEVWHQMKEGLKAWDMVLPEIFDEALHTAKGMKLPALRDQQQKPVTGFLMLGRGQVGVPVPPVPPVPLPYLDHHIDQRIVFSPRSPKISRTETSAQYFVPGKNSWMSRPGPLPPLESWDQGYRVRLGSLVIVGSFAQTFTSINTMEAANESARHGVNALLEHYERKKDDSPYVRYERCTLWPLEADEPADLDFWKDVDRNLYWDDDNDRPREDPRHLFEILGLDSWLAALRPDPKLIDNAVFSKDKLWDSDGWKRFEKGFGGLWDKLLTLGRFSSPFSNS